MNKSSDTTTPVNKHVRFSNFITYLGEPEPTFPEMEESLRMDSSKNLFASMAGPPSRRSSNGSNNGGGRVCKRQSLDLCDMFGTPQNFGQTTVVDGSSGGFSFGFSGSGLDLECSIREEDEYEYDDDIPRDRNIDNLKDTFNNKLRLKDNNNNNNNNCCSSDDDSRNNSSSLEFDTIGSRQKFGQSFLMCSFEKSSDSSSLFSLNSSSSLRMDKQPPQQTSSSDSIRSSDSNFAVGTAAWTLLKDER